MVYKHNINDPVEEFMCFVEDFQIFLNNKLSEEFPNVKRTIEKTDFKKQGIVHAIIKIKLGYSWWHFFRTIGTINLELSHGNLILLHKKLEKSSYSQKLELIIDSCFKSVTSKINPHKFSYGII